MEQPGKIADLWYRLVRGFFLITWRAYLGFRCRGAAVVPDAGPVLLVSNHQSYLDPLLIPTTCRRRLRFMARDTLFKGIQGWFIGSLGAIPVDRDGTALSGVKQTLKCLGSGQAVLLFPEGTRSETGELQPLKPGFLSLVRRKQPTIVVVALDGAQRAWPRGQLAPRPRLVAVRYGRAILPAEYGPLDDEALLSLVSRELASCLAQARAMLAER
jgi:1-acyl-sn-glycerol-3-phosphate acyltransferase